MSRIWLAIRRPLGVALATGCAISCMTEGAVTLRLALPAAVYWSFIPLLEIAGLSVALRRVPDGETIDTFFAGHGPWLLWLAGFAALWAFVPAPVAYGGSGFPQVWYAAGVGAAVWSALIDYRFFRGVRKGSGRSAARDVLVHRLVSWPAAFAIFVAPAAWQRIASVTGL